MYRTNTKVKVAYVPHGINQNKFYPINENHPEWDELIKYKESIFGDFNPEFILFYNSRNIRRKMTNDILFAYKLFHNSLPKELAEKCVLLLHTQPIDENGTDLPRVKEHLLPECNVQFTNKLVDTKSLNFLYNIADATINISSNEGWGLSTSESLMAGTPIIINITGGLQDQCRFEDENGIWIDFSPEFPTNSSGRYIKFGEWAIPIFPVSRSLQGSIPTPYIFDDRCRIEDIKNAIKKMYSFGRDERKHRGLSGREWVISDESKISANKMCESFMLHMDKTLNEFQPRKRFSIYDTKIKSENMPVCFNEAERNIININEEITKINE